MVEQDVSVHQITCARLLLIFSDASSLLCFSEDGPADAHTGLCREVERCRRQAEVYYRLHFSLQSENEMSWM